MKKNLFFAFAVLVSLTLACSLTSLPTTSGTTPVANNNNPSTSNTSSTSSTPVTILKGLASLDTYFLVIEINYSGPTQADTSNMRYEIQRSNAQDARSIHQTSTTTSSDSDPNTNESYTYSISNGQCSGNDIDGWTFTENTPQETEMINLMGEIIDFVPLVDNPDLVGSETINGILSDHFSFQVSGLGLQSGAEVTANQGDYWLAKDGHYIVKYNLVTETLDTTTQTILNMEVLIDLTDVNQPVNIIFPTGCEQQ
jgi:hypothetical protein